MKVKVAIIALVILGLSACTQRTCPTYADADTTEQKSEQKEQNV